MNRFDRDLSATLRQPSELVARGLAPESALADLERVAARYAIAVTPAVAALIDNPQAARAMGAAGRKRIEDELGWPQLARRYVGHFEKMKG